MAKRCRYTTKTHECIIELTNSEHAEVMEIMDNIASERKKLAKLLKLYEDLSPERVYKTPKVIDLESVLNDRTF